jgi:UDP-N-acetylmuramoylalanine--D-glutamate ligase
MASSAPDILVLGLGASGASVAHYCAQRMPSEFASVTVFDAADTPALQAEAGALEAEGVVVRLGSAEIAGRFDLCVASPGIPPHAPLMQAARAASDRVISEIEFAFERSACPWIAVTGTNGKTTTTALVAHLLVSAGMPARAAGNIGTPAIEVVAEDDAEQVIVAEVSSFQLALSEAFHPRVAVLLNVTPDHVDWHGSLERYALDKARVFANLDSDDTAVVDVDDAGSAALLGAAEATGAHVARVSRSRCIPGGACAPGGVLSLMTLSGTLDPVLPADQLLVRGAHNVSNALAAAAAAHAIGVTVHDLREGLRTFKPIEHRLEPLGTFGGVEWFNDSKATNPDAVSKALEAFDEQELVLLLGGRNKGNDFGPLAEEAAQRARAVVLFGEARDELEEAFAATRLSVTTASGLAEAVAQAVRIARPGEAVVLSPACASFDEFNDYEHRGRTFKDLVAQLDEGPDR